MKAPVALVLVWLTTIVTVGLLSSVLDGAQTLDLAFEATKAAAEKGDASAQASLGFMYRFGQGVAKDEAEAVKWYRKAAEQGLAQAQSSLGFMYAHGSGVPKDVAEAAKWYRKAGEQGLEEARINLATLREEGMETAGDGAEALKRDRAAAEKGDAQAQSNLGVMYANGDGVSKDAAEAVKWFRRAADQGHAEAQNNLGFMYANGEGVPKDVTEAVKWLCKAADQGLAQAQYNLGVMYANGVPKDTAEAVKWFRRAANQGHAKAQYNLGSYYAEGKGVPKDAAEAVKWYRKAADQGLAEAQCNLGRTYANGDGVPKDVAEAVKWSRRAADQGLAQAQCNLGLTYAKGDGVPKDAAEAVKWFRRAADQGHATAQVALGLMYAKGNGVPKDDVEAYKWLNLAAAGGSESAVEGRAIVERTMSREEIIEAQRRSRAFVPPPASQAGGSSPDRLLAFSERSEPTPKQTGTGFFLSEDGFLLSNYHVVEEADRIMVKTKTGLLPARLVRSDAANDLALLKVSGSFKSLPVLSSRGVKLGDTVFTLGFPNVQLQGFEPKLTKGEINGLAGAQDDPRHFQISAAIQPGNSGGPLVNLSGNVVAIVTARLSDAAGLLTSGALPQNVNYALKSSYVLVFLESVPELAGKLKQSNPDKDRKFDSVVSEVTESVVLILAY